MTTLNDYQSYALGSFLADWPDDTSYEGILELIRDEDDLISVWQPFVDWTSEDVVTLIENMVASLTECFTPKPESC